MAESKFSGIADAIKEAQQQPPALDRTEVATSPKAIPPKAGKGRAPGKRSDPAWRQHTIMLRKETHLEATDLIRRQDNGQDISDLVQSLLEQWVKRNKRQ